MRNLFDKIKEFTLFIVTRFQRILMTLLLLFTYTFLCGMMLILVSLFGRRLLWPPRKKDSYWEKPDGYGPNLQESLRQS
jgi:hypothetical protein